MFKKKLFPAQVGLVLFFHLKAAVNYFTHSPTFLFVIICNSLFVYLLSRSRAIKVSKIPELSYLIKLSIYIG